MIEAASSLPTNIGDWNVAGTYYETCNCIAVCPCRRLNGKPGGRSSFGTCQFLLSWWVAAGSADGTDLSDCSVAMAGFYDDDEAGSPWRVVLYIDVSASESAFEVLKLIFLGRAAGNILFTSHIAEVIGVRRARIILDHTKGAESISVEDRASARVERRAVYDGTVTCAIPGHEHVGEESISRAKVTDGPLSWSYQGRCGFATVFRYHS
jgi:hypothetical protein